MPVPNSQIEEARTALVNADAAGDTEAATALAAFIQSNNGTPAAKPAAKTPAKPVDKFDLHMAGDDGHDASEYAPPDEKTSERFSRRNKLARKEGRIPAVPMVDAAIGMVAGGASQVAGGLAGAGRALYGMAMGDGVDASLQKGADTVNKVSEMAYRPRTAAGQNITEAAGLPFEMGSKATGAIGGAIGSAVGGEKGRAAGETIGEAAVPVAATLLGGAAAVKNRAGSQASQAAEAAAKATERGEVLQRAEIKARTSGLDWGKLNVAARKQIATLVTDATNAKKLEAITPDMVKRAAEMKALPVPITATKGQLARDPVQLRAEQQLSQTSDGAPLRQRYVEQNQGLLDNLDNLGSKGSPKATTSEEVGRQVAEKALGAKAAEGKAKVRKLYDQANKSAESAETVSPYPLLDYVRDHPNAAAVSWITDRLKKNQIVTGVDDLGQPQLSRDIKLREVSELRKVAERIGQSGSEGSGWVPEVKAVLDQMIEGKGGEAFKAARGAYKDYKGEFANQEAVSKLLETKGGKYSTDRKVALEDVFDKSIVKGSIQDVRNLRESLLTAESKGTRKQGRKALRELAGETVNYIRQEATKGVVDESGAANVSAPALKRALDKIGDEKLDLLLGETTATQLRAVVKAAEDLKTSPPKRIQGSDTGVNAMMLLDKVFSHLPVVGNTIRGTIRLAGKATEVGKAGKAVDESLMIPATPFRMKDSKELRAFLPGAAAASIAEEGRP
ncbi:MAG: hypothetical protein JWR07_1899 [Nevskia sp.]|nr:hypothetical protein [Nevskia sp.]